LSVGGANFSTGWTILAVICVALNLYMLYVLVRHHQETEKEGRGERVVSRSKVR
jgi:putative exporter of polyketide antibiotics